jgi:hypothetical protein
MRQKYYHDILLALGQMSDPVMAAFHAQLFSHQVLAAAPAPVPQPERRSPSPSFSDREPSVIALDKQPARPPTPDSPKFSPNSPPFIANSPLYIPDLHSFSPEPEYEVSPVLANNIALGLEDIPPLPAPENITADDISRVDFKNGKYIYAIRTLDMLRDDRQLPEDHERVYPGFSEAVEEYWKEKLRVRNLENLEEYLRGGEGPTGKYQRLMWCQLPEVERRRLEEFV